MARYSTHSLLGAFRHLNHFQWVVLFVSLALMVVGSVVASRLIETRYLQRTEAALTTILTGTQGAINLWAQDHLLSAKNFAAQQSVIDYTQQLLVLPEEKKALLTSPFQVSFREIFRRQLDSGQYRGFSIISPENTNLASSQDSNIGAANLLSEQPDVLAEMWSGKTVFSRVQNTDLPLYGNADADAEIRKTMFVGAPIRDQEGRIIALLTLRIDPYQTLYPILVAARLGASGETYAIDNRGVLLTPSRFNQAIDATPALKQSWPYLRIADPGVDLTKRAGEQSGEDWPLTFMAQQLTQKKAGSNLQGYRDYRGVPVIGAWAWNELLNIGVTTEQDVEEAFATFYFVRLVLYASMGLAAATLLLVFWAIGFGQQRTRGVEKRLASIVNTAADGIITLNDQGVIETVNPAVEHLFACPATQLVSMSIDTLFTEPPFGSHGGSYYEHLIGENEFETDLSKELEARRADGSIFPVQLSMARMALDGGVHFSCIIKDITEAKLIERYLQQEREFTVKVINALQAHIVVLDLTGTILMTNRAWDKFAEDNGAEPERVGAGSNYLEVLAAARGEETRQLHQKLRAVINKEMDSFTYLYPCHSPGQHRWFEMRVNRFEHQGGEALVVSHVDVTSRLRYEQRLKKVNADLQAEKDKLEQVNEVLALTSQALNRTGTAEFWIGLDDGRIIRASQQVCDHLGYTMEEVLRLHVWDFDYQYDPEAFSNIAAELKQSGWKRFESVHQTQDGRRVPVEITAAYHGDALSGKNYIVAFAQDITQRKESEAQLILSRKTAEDANRAKSTFLATMSHEIRTPLNGIVGTIDLLGHTPLEPSQRELVATAVDSAHMLQQVIDDILDFSKIEVGRLELEEIPVHLGEVLESLTGSLRILAQQKNIELLIFCDPQLPQVVGDPVKIKQMLFNLVGNALKFGKKDSGEAGKVRVFIEQTVRQSHSVSFRMIVRDNGIGMSEEVQKRVFNPFTQADQSINRQYGGSGLGLVITRRLVDLMGGDISLRSAPGEGAEFTVSLTLPVAKETEPGTGLLDIDTWLIRGGDPDIERIFRCYLESAGARVVVHNAEELIGVLQDPARLEWKKCIVVIDPVGNPGCSTELKKAIAEHCPAGKIHYLLVGRGRRVSPREVEQNGVSIDLDGMRRDTFLNAVAAAVGREPVRPVEKIVSDKFDPSKPLTRQEAMELGRLILLVDDNATNRKVIGWQLGTLGCYVDMAEDGQQAFEMWQMQKYNLVLTDCHMPVMDGYELARKIRQHEARGQATPIVAVTADALKDTANSCYAAGMNAYLTKPMQLPEIQQALQQWLGGGQKPATGEALASSGSCPTDIDQEPVDSKVLAQLLGSDDAAMLAGFYQDFLSGGRDTVEALQRAYADRTLSLIGQMAHKLKSSARTVGANALADCCLELEKMSKQGDDSRTDELVGQLLELFAQVEQWISDNA